MANYNTVITNEGAALLASVIASQGTLTLTEMRFSTNDYSGSEATLTYGTFSGVFITAAAAGSVVDSTTIKAASQFDNSSLVGDNPLYSIGLVGTDGNTTALIAVSTTTAPDIIRPAVTGVSTYAFNMNLTVSSTNNITVTGTTAAVLYDIDVVDTLISTATDKPLSANMGRVLSEDKAERADLATLNLTGSTNSTGSTIYAGTYFYLNDSYCKAKTSIANGATFTLNTNYEEVTVGGELNNKVDKWTLIATATGDGVKTWSQIISELTSNYNSGEFYKYRIIRNDDNAYYPMDRYTFVQVNGADTVYTSIYFRMIVTNTSSCYEATNTLTPTDYSTYVFSGTLKLYKMD